MIKVTQFHPFFINGAWKEIGKAEVGDLLRTMGGVERIFSIERIDDTVRVYNFEVEGNNNYFAEGYLVHNKQRGLGRGALLSPPIDEEKGFFGKVWGWISGLFR